MSKDYRGFEDRMTGDMHKASLQAQTLEDSPKSKGGVTQTQKLRMRGSDIPDLIPPGSTIEFDSVPFHKLKFGDIVFCRFGRELVLRRFIRLVMKRDGNSDMHVTQQGPNNMVQILGTGALIGRVISVEHRGQTYNPLKRESQMQQFKNRYTEFGTTNPLEKLMASWEFFKKMMKK